MPKFDNLLRESRRGRVQVIHEFLTNFNPSKNRVHCFYESTEDEVFYRHFISQRTDVQLLGYMCGNKDDVYSVFAFVVKHPGYRQSLFFVDKDFAELLNELRPVDARILVTAGYSVENYLVCADVFKRFCRDFLRCRGVACDHDVATAGFGETLVEFHKLILPVMAWILAVRRRGLRPNLRNIKLSELFTFDSNVNPRRALKRNRIAHLCEVTGIPNTKGLTQDIRRALGDLSSQPLKSVVRGHFESWFLVEYLKAFITMLKAEAAKQNGAASMNPSVEHSNFVSLAVPFISIPPELGAFCCANLPAS